jgi:hypothetical protein
MYLNEIREACADGLAAAEMAERVGQNRAEMLGRLVAGFMHAEQRQLDAGREEVEKAIALARRLGASHFIVEGLCIGAMIHMAAERSDEASRVVGEALGILRDAGMTFFGPLALGLAARLTTEARARASLLSEAEAILDRGCVSHNYFWFYREAIEGALESGDWPEAERYCDALERYTSAEPLPWSDLFVARGRALAQFGRGNSTAQVAAELQRVAAIMEEAGYALYLRVIESALKAS